MRPHDPFPRSRSDAPAVDRDDDAVDPAAPPSSRAPSVRQAVASPGCDGDRRRGLTALAGLALAVAGCGGGGGGGGGDGDRGGNGSDGRTNTNPATGGAASGGRSPDAAPVSGPFGGGQGKIVFAAGSSDRTIYEFDLASRVPTKLATIDGVFAEVDGGITRANNGRIAALLDTGNLDSPVEIRIFEPNGTLAFKHPAYYWGIHSRDGAAISPSGQWVAIVGVPPLGNDWSTDTVTVVLVDVATGRFRLVIVEQGADLPEYSPTLCWTPDNRLLLLTNVFLYEIDTAAATATKRFAVDLAGPAAAMVTADGREIWFHQGRGNPYGGTIWSLDLASAEVRRRSLRSAGWGQHCPAISPDGQWMLASEGTSRTDGASVFLTFAITATRIKEPPIDVNNFANEILDSAGKSMGSTSRMAWF